MGDSTSGQLGTTDLSALGQLVEEQGGFLRALDEQACSVEVYLPAK